MQIHLNLGLTPQRMCITVLVSLLLIGCSDETAELQNIESVKEITPSVFELLNPELSSSAKEIILEYVEQIGTDLLQVAIEIEIFYSSIGMLTRQVNNENLSLSKQAWLDAHSAYELTTLHRYFAMQMLGEQNSLTLMQIKPHGQCLPGFTIAKLVLMQQVKSWRYSQDMVRNM